MKNNKIKKDLCGTNGIPVDIFKHMLDVMNTGKISCIYRFSLGTCEDLRHTLNLPNNLPDNYVIIKYGILTIY